MDKVFEVKNVSKTFKGGVKAVTDISFDVKEGEIVCILGESGSGKSTLLRIMGGMEDADTGSVMAMEEEITGPKDNLVPGYDFINYVFQNFRLEPFRTVKQNISSVISYYEEEYLEERVQELLVLCRIEDKADVFPYQLSGGQQQRVAIAMALADEPEILLMDEPFSSLDVSMKTQIREEIVEILREAEVTVVMVSHDPADALAIADRAMILENGHLIQIDKPKKIYDKPASPYAAKFLGPINYLKVNNKIKSIRPEKMEIVDDGKFEGKVWKSIYFGLHYHIYLDTIFSDHHVLLYSDHAYKKGDVIKFQEKK